MLRPEDIHPHDASTFGFPETGSVQHTYAGTATYAVAVLRP
jgi:hypothetical protein